jgi:Fur family peroxide stress response transcriptional regulator
MNSTSSEIQLKLKDRGLKVTPQRIAVLEAIYELKNHPTAENIIDYIRKTHRGIASGTVYRVLDVLVENHLIKKVKTERDVMRYDGILEHHHHLYCSECDKIEDYVDNELDELLKKYFSKKSFPGFHIDNIVLQIKGKFDNCST